MVYLPTMVAKNKGFFAEEGLDVEIQYLLRDPRP